jgi:hypothetical protein
VTFAYYPKPFLYGLLLTICTIMGWAGAILIVFYRRLRRRKVGSAQPEAAASDR